MTTETGMQASVVAEEARVDNARADESPLVSALGKVGLASIGALSLTLEAADKLLRRMVERGEADERNLRRKISEFRQKRPRLPRPPRPVLAVRTEKLASKADVQALEQQVAALSAQVEQLNKGTLGEA